MQAIRKRPFLALAGGVFLAGFFAWGPVDFRTYRSWGIRCDLQPDVSLAQEIKQCEEVLAEQAYEGEALGEVYFRLGYFHHRQGKWREAFAYYQEARKLRPARISAHYNTALILGRYTEDWHGVVNATSDVIDLIAPEKSVHSDAWAMRAIALHQLGRDAEALSDISVALTIDPGKQRLIQLREIINRSSDTEL
jgi:tetratricopeptide (TPR) repeat protein